MSCVLVVRVCELSELVESNVLTVKLISFCD